MLFHSLSVHRQSKIIRMECLHGKPALATTTKNGLFWYCGNKPSCQFFCPQKDRDIFARAVTSFQASGCSQPVCSVHQRLAKMRVVKDNSKGNIGRPFFVCSDRNNPCSFWQWGDVIESPKPICQHGLVSCIRKVKKDSPNRDRLFYCCPNDRENSCGFFEWKTKEEDDPLYSFCDVLYSYPPSYRYTVKSSGETFTSHETDHKKAYNEYLSRKPEDYVTNKSPNPDSNEAYGEFLYNLTANATALGLF